MVFFFAWKMESKFIPVRGNPSSPTKNTDYPFGVIGIFLFREDAQTPGKCTELKKIWIVSVNTAKKNRT